MTTSINTQLKQDLLDYLLWVHKITSDKRSLELIARLKPKKPGRKVGWRKVKE